MSNLVIHVIPRHDPVNYYYPVSRVITVGERIINNTADMVRQLRAMTTRKKFGSAHTGAPRTRRSVQVHHIERLIITGHGTPTSFRIGTDRVTLAVLQDPSNAVSQQLRQIAPLFTQNGLVVLRQCRTGQSQPLMSALSRVLGGVRVRGSEDAQMAFAPGLIGDVVECRMDTCREVD